MSSLRLLAIIEASSITGPAKNLLEFVRLSRESGVETIIATFVRDAGENLFIRTAREFGIQVEPIQERGPFDPAALQSLGDLAGRVKPDIIQSHAVKSHFLVRRGGLPRTAPWIAFHHGYTWPTLRARFYNQFDRWSLGAASRVLTVSRPFRDELVALGVSSDRIEIIHNAIRPGWGAGAATEQTAALRKKLGIPEGRKVLLIVGRLSREKDHRTLLEVLHKLAPQFPPATPPHLVIVGEGPERPRIEQRIQELQLGEFVTMTGQQPSAEPFYAIADLAVLSSLSEGSPNALLEAMAAGVPVVATTVGGIPEIVTNEESALLIRPRDREAMARAIERLLISEPGLAGRLVAKARTLIETRHTPQERVRRLLEVYGRARSGHC